MDLEFHILIKDGAVAVSSNVGDKMMAYAMLEIARDEVKRIADEQDKSAIQVVSVLPGGSH